jgi:hypothetical protein
MVRTPRSRRQWVWGACSLAVAGLFLWQAPPAQAIREFQEEFLVLYIDSESEDPQVRAFAELVEKADCHLCHQGRLRRDRNRYGTALSEFLDRREDRRDTAKIRAALQRVAEIRSDAEDDSAPTFGELIRTGKLPGGELKPEDLEDDGSEE